MIQIKNRYTGEVLYKGVPDAGTPAGYELRNVLERAVRERVDLTGANLTYAILSYANLSYANLSYADLSYANLSYADLSYADLAGAILTRANLTGADLTGADLTYAILTRANLTDAILTRVDLTDAILTRVDLTRADLTGADLTDIRSDFYEVLNNAVSEIPALRAALVGGNVDGSTYTGTCSCLVGTIAKARGVGINGMPGIRPDSTRPAERWFMGISKGDTPSTNQISKITVDWIDQFGAQSNA